MVIELILRLIISVLLGALIGMEREWAKKPAGLRTHMLVSLGSCLFTIISINFFQMDPARVAAGIVTGIGFLGAGTIIGSGSKVKGLTTAASLWVIAAIGVGVGIGNSESYLLSFITAVLVFFILQLGKIERSIEY